MGLLNGALIIRFTNISEHYMGWGCFKGCYSGYVLLYEVLQGLACRLFVSKTKGLERRLMGILGEGTSCRLL